VTAGALNDVRALFQLFGDTIDTAARMARGAKAEHRGNHNKMVWETMLEAVLCDVSH